MSVGLSRTAPIEPVGSYIGEGQINETKVKSSPARFYRPELNVLRAAAFLAVFIHHFSISYVQAHSGGASSLLDSIFLSVLGCTGLGLDLFFCLSAFLISTLLLREMDRRGTINVRAFLMRRALRIFPLYFVAVAAGALLVPHLFPEERVGASFLLALTCFVANWACVFQGYSTAFLSSLWCISAEQQFYTICPFILPWLSRKRLWVLSLAALALATAARGLVLWRGMPAPAIWTNTLARLDPFAIGVIFALLVRRRNWRPGRPLRFALLALGLTACPIAVFCLGVGVYHGLWSLMFYPLAAVSVWAVLASLFNLETVRWPELVLKAGDLSYGMFVFHVISILLARHLHALYLPHTLPLVLATAIDFVFALAVTWGLAEISYRYLELPFLRRKERFTTIVSGRAMPVPEAAAVELPSPVMGASHSSV